MKLVRENSVRAPLISPGIATEDRLPSARSMTSSLDMGMEYNTGSTVLIMKDTGLITRLKVRAPSGTLRVTSTEESSKTIWLTDTESTLTSTAASIKESSETMSKRATVKKSGLMAPSMLAATAMA